MTPSFNPCVIGYVPPPDFGCSKVFLANLRKFKTTYPVLLFSDHAYEGMIKLKAPVDLAKQHATERTKPFAIANGIFYVALKIASEHGYSHMLYVESDCRVGCDNWDGVMFDEYLSLPVPTPTAGTIVCYNPCNVGLEGARRLEELIKRTEKERLIPIAMYGSRGANDPGGISLFANGALAIYSLDWMRRLFPMQRIVELAGQTFAFDFEIGLRLYEMIGLAVFDSVGLLTKSYSGYGDVYTTEEQRMEMLRSGQIVAVHQVKSKETM